jgi:hypothetical protein
LLLIRVAETITGDTWRTCAMTSTAYTWSPSHRDGQVAQRCPLTPVYEIILGVV